ncbi:hypothetical protein B9Z19DRAFT_1103255 [Tuber borchii]|uniref:Ubiquitin-like modifier-activating enzyme ATG7 n=1 Tax=Tuber borchii TaxID=42251 RepID=A0A2T6ZH72_TUBBO|nr:hypothetical protein B9Z19DRAFT_1103255 [Tuber borchii]
MKYAPFSSLIDLQFYYSLASHKIDYDKLDESPRKVLGQYLPHDGGRMQIHGSALTSDEVAITACRAEGMIKNYNTIEDFRRVEKTVMIKRSAQTIWDAILDGSIYSCPSLLSSFLILSYADLKKYKFHHLFAFPAFAATPQWTCKTPIERLDRHQTASLVEAINTWRYNTDSRQHGFFLLKRDEGAWKIGSLGDFEQSFFDKDVDEEDRFVAFVDPSDYPDNPGWPLRNLLMLVRKRWGWRKVRLDEMPKVVGWEKNDDNKIVPKIANLSAQMDPKKQADINVDLNLKLMKWRVAPELDLDAIRNTRCLLLGAGTLGAYVARNLLSWGVHKITFIDSGTVSFSNPVRQPLYTFQDCIGGKTMKAIRAAEALKEIYPGVDAQGFDMTVPMAAHPFSDAQEAGVKQDYLKLRRLFDEHDVIFLLMDTRESRWLPTVMGKSMGKLVMNAALGFDSYVVMRHGVKPSDDQKGGEELGCYYCSDVVAPGDSLSDRTLDQQCTVTRPGVAPIASALLVETLVSVLQHPLGAAAPAPNNDKADRSPSNHPLGLIPHQMRGFLSSFHNIMVKGPAYDCCSACSPAIIKEYKVNEWEFVKKALNQKGYVEEVSGLLEVQRRADEVEMDDSDDDDDDDGDGI